LNYKFFSSYDVAISYHTNDICDRQLAR